MNNRVLHVSASPAGKQPISAPPVCWLDGRQVKAEEAVVSVFDHGLLYGDGVFEGLRFYQRRIFKVHEHLARLSMSARAIGLQLPYSLSELHDALCETVTAAATADGYLRLVITRGRGPLGIDPARCERPTVFIIADRLQMVSERVRQQGATVIIAATRRLGPDGLDPRIKSLNYLNHILARMEASHAGADEAILLNSAGRVTEGSADNIFILQQGELLTPPTAEGALDGITRKVVLEIAAQLAIPCRETPLTPYDLHVADECFLTGTGAELIPVAMIDGRPVGVCPGPVFLRIQAAFQQYVARDSDG